MTLEEHIFDIPSEHEQNVFGQFDVYLKKIERTTGVSAITRDDGLKLLGSEAQVSQAKQVHPILIKGLLSLWNCPEEAARSRSKM